MFDLQDLMLAFLAALLLMAWWRAGTQKMRALAVASRHCERLGLQLLDETLAFSRHRLLRDARGRRRLCRIYEFDFCSNGMNRHSGEIVMSGLYALRIVLEDNGLEVIEL